MKISDVKVYLARDRRTYCFVVVETDEGISGLGTAGISGRELAVQGAIEHFKPLLIGQDPFRAEHIWQLLFRGGFYPAQRILTAAIAAIDIALWDIKGKALDVPVYELLGGRARDRVLTYNHNHGETVEELVACCQRSVDEGWKALRWKLAHKADDILEPDAAVRDAIKEFAALRLALGDEIKLALDVHTRLNMAHSLWLCQEVEQYRPFFIEDPLRVENAGSYRHLRGRTAVPLAAGEQYSSKWEFRQVIEEELIDYARIDPCICGGITEAKKIAAACETHYIDLAVHNPIGPVATSAFLHLCLSVPNCAVQELPRRPGQTLPDLIINQPQWEDGYLLPPTAPGLGIALNHEALSKYPFSMNEPTHLRRADGSVTNW